MQFIELHTQEGNDQESLVLINLDKVVEITPDTFEYTKKVEPETVEELDEEPNDEEDEDDGEAIEVVEDEIIEKTGSQIEFVTNSGFYWESPQEIADMISEMRGKW